MVSKYADLGLVPFLGSHLNWKLMTVFNIFPPTCICVRNFTVDCLKRYLGADCGCNFVFRLVPTENCLLLQQCSVI